MWLDGLIAALAVAALAAAVVFHAVLGQIGGTTISTAVNLAYVLADALMLALVVVAFAVTGWRLDRAWVWLGCALAVFALSDIAGDALLAGLGHKLERELRPWGRAYRMGGDEFCALLEIGSKRRPSSLPSPPRRSARARAEVESARGHRHDRLVMDQQVLQVGIAVVLAAAVMAVIAPVGRQLRGYLVRGRLPTWRRHLVEPFEHVLVQTRLVVVDPDAGGDVHRRDQHHPLRDPGLVDRCLHLLSDADQLTPLRGVEGHVGGVGFHWRSSAAS
jgi:hypothetical protein